jgi:hypothetical protein
MHDYDQRYFRQIIDAFYLNSNYVKVLEFPSQFLRLDGGRYEALLSAELEVAVVIDWFHQTPPSHELFVYTRQPSAPLFTSTSYTTPNFLP